MANRNKILSELQSLSPLVADIVPVNPYKVPEGYFENLAAATIAVIKDEVPSEILSHARLNPYQVPAGYFDQLPAQMVAIVKNEEPVLNFSKGSNSPYQIPDGYFENLAGQVLNRIKTQSLDAKEELEALSPLLSRLGKQVPFSTPAGYFENLSQAVPGIAGLDARENEIEELSPVLLDLKSKSVYTVPVGYFDNLPSEVLRKVMKPGVAKVVKMDFSKRVMRYAAAAVVAGIVVVAGYLFVNRNSTVPADVVAQTEEKLQQDALKQIKEFSDDELVNFMENQTTPIPELLNLANGDLDSEDVKTMLADVTDDELKKYLEEYGGENEVITN